MKLQFGITLRPFYRHGLSAAFAILLTCWPTAVSWAQITTGMIEGTVRNSAGDPQPDIVITALGSVSAAQWTAKSDARGRFQFILPHGDYEIRSGSSIKVHVPALQMISLSLTLTQDLHFGTWSSNTVFETLLGATLFSDLPGVVVNPVDFTGAANIRIPLLSQHAYSWTGTTFSFEGMNATDPYQPGRPLVFPDTETLDEMAIANSFGAGVNIGLFLRTPSRAWHGDLDFSGTSSALSSDNLPLPANRAALQQAQQYNWFTRDHADLGGSLGRRLDVFFSATGQWASEKVPIAPPGQDLSSRLLFGTFSARYQPSDQDQLELLLSGSRINLSNWGQPVALEAFTGWRGMPAFESPFGFNGLAEADRQEFIQGSWIRQLRSGVLELRYGASVAHLDTNPTVPRNEPSETELLDGTVTGAPPISNLAMRERQSLRAVLQPRGLQLGSQNHRIAIGAAWEHATIENRFSSPSGPDLITAGGVPAYAIELNTPDDSKERVQSSSIFLRDQLRLTPWLSIDAGARADFSNASGSSIEWNTASPHAGFTLLLPGLKRLSFGGSYSRFYAPLAARYLDFANPDSLSGLVYSWNGSTEPGTLLRRFGGAYSSISPSLRPPYADEFRVQAEFSINSHSFARVQLFRRDDKNRIIAADVGVPFGAYSPVETLDPGPDGIPGTFDDRTLAVYQQSPSTFGADRYLLENQPDLRMLFEGFTAELASRFKQLTFHASFTADKSFGPTNPGNGLLENDPGIVGALYQDPNTLINATGHEYFDRSYLGKIQLTYQLPQAFGGLEFVNTANYQDGLPFARELLVTGLAQGPIVVPATLRGSPEGGNRAEYVLNWNLRLARSFTLPKGRLRFGADILNVTNAANRIQEVDLTGLSFNQRLPVEIEAPRTIRFNVQFLF